jgi:predicted dehydrogenase
MANGSSPKRIRYAVVGVGHIAQVAVLPAFKNAKENSELVAIVTGSRIKGESIKEKYKKIEVVTYENYENFCRSGRADAVYIALPNDLHYEYSKIALNCGLHVLCEKPFTLEPQQAKELYQLARRKGLKLMVAYRLHFESSNLKAAEIARSKEIGELKYFTSHFSFQIADPENIRLKAARGGGPIWDIGIYCINAVRYLFRDEPLEVMAMAEKSKDPRFREVDETVSVLLRFPKNRLASFVCSFGASDAAEYHLYGTKGHLRLTSAYEYIEGRTLEVQVDQEQRIHKYKKIDQFAPELLYFSDCVIRNRQPEPSGLEGMMDVRVILAILESIKTKRAVRLRAPQERVSHPDFEQRGFKAPVRKVHPVQVESPT